ncbi:MAG TPA: vitamin K epoxide reductase family protein [Candidatus Nanoarchaeia archaeon]|nr:vitamin K epoxide reductase family protein [Candidatus Nanoarchaeia archaeon]
MKRANLLLWLILFLALTNIAITATLAIERYLWAGIVDPTKCLTNPESGCFAVMHSSYAQTFGIENTTIGLLGFLLVFSAAAILLSRYRSIPTDYLEYGLFGLLAIGALGAFWFLSVQVFLLKAFCRFCVTIDSLSLVMFGIGAWRFHKL